ncbi:MAG TPA: rRNA maturation RNase YbeY [Anaerolineaceae bacterium]|nr:rRNA maturation RNase YbeY [Anaerolineaceae bacterium]
MKKNQLTVSSKVKDFDKSLLSVVKQAVQITLDQASVNENYSISILISDDEKIRELNKTYRGIDKTTDVLSFSSGDQFPDSKTIYLGDVVISYPTALRQSVKHEHPVSHEMALLSVHGVLHLLGYDHATIEEEKKMWRLQETILSSMDYLDQ